MEYGKLTEEWLSLGAIWCELGSYVTVWEYRGTRFFKWYSGTGSVELLGSAKEADRVLGGLLT